MIFGLVEKMISFRLASFFLLLSISLVACAGPLFQPAPSATPLPTDTPAPSPTPIPEYASISQLYWGAFNAGVDMEQKLGQKFAGQLYYHTWGRPFGAGTFEYNAEKGWITQVTWEYRPGFGVSSPYVLQPLKAIVDGEFDEYLRDFAKEAATLNKPLFLRWGHEMNGDWYPWGGVRNGGATPDKYGDPQKADGPELYVDAYRHIHDIFEQEKADKVLWVWCPNVAMTGPLGEPWNAIANYYPGDEYVDWLCVDGYNWGTSQSWSKWQTFDEVYAETYAQLQAINASKPMMIGEFASSEIGGDKAAWISDTLQRIPAAYPQIKFIFWFHINKETDWRFDSSEASLNAFINGFKDPIWSEEAWPGITP